MGIFPINKGRGQSATLPLKPPSYALIIAHSGDKVATRREELNP